MQLGHSKDHRPDLAQIKVMAAVAQPSGLWIASSIESGESADDPLYVPIAARAREILSQRGLLYIGDSKMAALRTRADFVAHQDYYLCPLPRTGETAQQIEGWIDEIVEGSRSAELIKVSSPTGDPTQSRLVGAGYEFERRLTAVVDPSRPDSKMEWTERVQVVRSTSHARRQSQSLDERLAKATEALKRLTPPVGRGHRQIRDEVTLDTEIQKVLDLYRVRGLMEVRTQREEEATVSYVGPGRGGSNRPTRTQTKIRYQITEIVLLPVALERQRRHLGWQAFATNFPAERMSLSEAQGAYRQSNPIEGGFHLLKDRPLGIRPLYVREDAQILGLGRLLTIALRVLTLIQIQVRAELGKRHEALSGLYVEAPNKTTDRPTSRRLLSAFVRAEITLTRIEAGGQTLWYLTPLPSSLQGILDLLHLPDDLYLRLLQNPPVPSPPLRE